MICSGFHPSYAMKEQQMITNANAKNTNSLFIILNSAGVSEGH